MRWGLGIYLVTTATLVAASLRRSDWHFTFLTDDPAIHLAVAKNLAFHGTWGVVSGHFQSASSSPLWVVLLASVLRIVSWRPELVPLLFNVAASICVIVVLGRNQKVLQPSLRRPLDVVATAVVVVLVLFLPALTVLAMEHTLHVALVLCAVVLFHKQQLGERTRFPSWLPFALLAVATWARFETMFLAAGLGVAFLALTLPGWAPLDRVLTFRRQLSVAIIAGAVSFVAFAIYAAFNWAMGQGFLPNSVLQKSQVTRGGDVLSLKSVADRFTADPLVAVLVVACIAALVLAWRSPVRRFVFPAVTVTVATTLHVIFAEVRWYDRYEVYLIAVAVYALFALAEEALPLTRRPPARSYVVAVLVIAVVCVCGSKVHLTVTVPDATADTYEQRYQAGRFLERYYANQPVATGELGYISLDHQGPVTDFFGLGDYDTLQERRRQDQYPSKQYWSQLARDRGFKVAVVYPETLYDSAPDDWILVGDWRLPRSPTTALDQVYLFLATTPDEVRPLEAHLQEFAETAPPGTQLELNDLAEMRADQLENGG